MKMYTCVIPSNAGIVAPAVLALVSEHCWGELMTVDGVMTAGTHGGECCVHLETAPEFLGRLVEPTSRKKKRNHNKMRYRTKTSK